MAWLILNDEVDYKSEFYPSHILGVNNEVIPVYMGASTIVEKSAIGIYVSDEDYKKIDHSKEYILIHNPDAFDEAPTGFINSSSSLFKIISSMLEELPLETIENAETVDRAHRHIW